MPTDAQSQSALSAAAGANRTCSAGRDPSVALASRKAIRPWATLGLLLLTGVLALPIDISLSHKMVQGHAPNWVHRFLEMVEPFGQPPVVIAVSLAVLLCGGARRGAGFRIAAGALLSGLAVDLLKMCVARIRPRHFNFQGTVFDTFAGLLPGACADSNIQSWPSGHTATAVGFCLALSAVFPPGRWLFRVLAVLVALQRIESGAHYLSDTLFAASVAYIVHLAVFGSGPLGRFFERIEARSTGFQARATASSATSRR
jgi:membrane-associated phospholipid phosphatase